ncbi:MAG: 3D-(3,5/4)-trihydroxycyclohexane-1,2-dione acylhydrolase (decyclizing) [Christensenellales bacterium]|jgi:3D-(3,5/4)-trihydroxycyclohexane-1,2-dione acylhydrolase (decyclizing)
MKTVRLTMAQALLKFLDNQYIEIDGVENKFVKGIFGIFGHGNCTGLGQALDQYPESLPYHPVHNEQGGVHAAISYTKMKNRREIFACTTSIGPGALNMVTAAGVATTNRLPVLLLPGDIFASRQPDPVLQQVEQFHDYTITANDAFKAVSRYWDRVSRPEQLMSAALHAMRVLTDPVNTGAVTLALPQDVQAESYDYPVEFLEKRVHHIERRVLSDSNLKRFVDLIKDKKRPLLICGGGVKYSGAEQALVKLASDFNIPITETHAGKGAIVWDNQYNMGPVGCSGTLIANRYAKDADLIIGVGTRFTDFTTSSKWAFQNENAKFASINVNNFDSYKLESLSVLADAKLALESITDALHAIGYKTAYTGSEFATAKKEWNEEIDKLSSARLSDVIPQTAALGVINKTIDKDAVIVAAAGTLPGCLQRMWKTMSPNTYNMEYGFSCMGYEVAGALGAKMADPSKEVYTIIGDGSYMMLNSELFTSTREKQKITLLLMNNYGHQCIDSLQKSAGQDGYGNEFRYIDEKTQKFSGEYVNVDYVKHAESMGCKGYRVRTVEELEAAIIDAKKQKVSVMIEVMSRKNTNTNGYDSWWRIGVADVSEKEAVQKSFCAMQEKVDQTRKY